MKSLIVVCLNFFEHPLFINVPHYYPHFFQKTEKKKPVFCSVFFSHVIRLHQLKAFVWIFDLELNYVGKGVGFKTPISWSRMWQRLHGSRISGCSDILLFNAPWLWAADTFQCILHVVLAVQFRSWQPGAGFCFINFLIVTEAAANPVVSVCVSESFMDPQPKGSVFSFCRDSDSLRN